MTLETTFTVVTTNFAGEPTSVDFDDLCVAHQYIDACCNDASLYMDGELIDTITPRRSSTYGDDDLTMLCALSLFV